MPLDEPKYKEFLTVHRKARTNPEDLLERYAITLPASDAEIKAQVDAVRAYWNKISLGSSGISTIAKWCRDRDDELRKQPGADLESVRWWQQAQQANEQKAEGAITELAGSLNQAYGTLGVVTAAAVRNAGKLLSLSPGEAGQAARRAGLTVIDEAIALPDTPLTPVVFDALARDLANCQVPTIPELLHPGSGIFKIVQRYECAGNRSMRLDLAAIDLQISEAGKNKDASNTTKQDALRKLRDAQTRGISLDVVALFHLMSLVEGTSAILAKGELERRGVDATDAATIAALLEGRQNAVRQSGAEKVHDLLESGELREAASLASSLSGDEAREVRQLVATRQQELAHLLASAEAALRRPDEALAGQLLRDAARISREDAEPRLAQVPPASAAQLRATGDGEEVRLFWERGPGHDASTVYVVARTVGRPPAAPGDGSQVHRGPATECADPDAPVATEVHYGVFALADGRPASRVVTTVVTALPTVRDVQAAAGVGTVTLSWQAPAQAEVRVTRTSPGAGPVAVPVTGNGVRLTALAEGVPQRFEVTAVYRGPGGAELASHPRHVTATPRAEAKPNRTLKVTTTEGIGSRVLVRASWSRIDASEVSLLRTSAPLPWPEGETITSEQAGRAGEAVTGHVETAGTACSMEFELLAGIHYLTALSAGGAGTVVGKTQLVAAIMPVSELAATPFTEYATISWAWPDGIELAEVSWQIGDDDQTADHVRLSRAEYRAKGGARVPLGAKPCAVEVRALIAVDGRPRPSAPATITVGRVVKVAIRYRVSGGPFSRARKVMFTADEPCAGARVRMFAVSSSVLPTKPGDGVIVLDTTLNLAPGVAAEHKVEVPRLKKPYWVRCFLVSGPGRLIDPPITELKEG
jgi:hypothetical protein